MLFLHHKLFALLEPEALAVDVDDDAVVQDAVDDGGSNDAVGKDLVPLGESLD